ncbi:hypothetical protein GBA52_005439 [Prunus armeniaca]|uniref:Uncharacterized protein LOC103326275 n=1 Tax=Prunus mume TaxID=102107 RepID=A0ABM0NLU8_PRUMU|nr:PREDICTED: uncharacterized protein LOC103326275 [Prunus mume]KAH0993956.1 hypothetical protein GBA52_005439 [Prunus armeniaca]
MAKNKNKKKRNDAASMDITEEPVSDLPQAMDTSESGAHNPSGGASSLKIKGRQMKRSKNARKKKAIVRAISKKEQAVEKTKKHESKTLRTQSAKLLYD